MMAEIWKDVEGFDPVYEVSNQGRVRNKQTSKIKKSRINKNNLCVVNLMKDKQTLQAAVHTLVANAFLENPEGKKYVCNLDHDPSNNIVENLCWMSPQERGATALGTQRLKEENGTPVTASSSKGVIGSFPSMREAARNLDISDFAIRAVVKGNCDSRKGMQFSKTEKQS